MPYSLEILMSLVTLTALEIVLGIDNLVFLAILSQRLPAHQQAQARRLGLFLAWVLRLFFLCLAVWIIKLSYPLFTLMGMDVSARDIFLVLGGLFLLTKATQEIHAELEFLQEHDHRKLKRAKFSLVVMQIGALDLVFSLDSLLTAIGLTERLWVMATAISIAILIMLYASEPINRFIERHPTIKMLALSFLILIGVVLIADGFEFSIPRGYIYFSIIFSLFVESLNITRNKKHAAHTTKQPSLPSSSHPRANAKNKPSASKENH